MSKNLTSRQVAFCELFAKYGEVKTRGQLYADAGFNSKDAKASSRGAKLLLKNKKVTDYIDELKGNIAKETLPTKEKMLIDIENALATARELGKHHAIPALLRLKADVAGLLEKKIKVDGNVGYQLFLPPIEAPREVTPIAIPPPKEEEPNE